MSAHAPFVESGRSGAAWLLVFVGLVAAAMAACVYAHAVASLAPLSVPMGESGVTVKLVAAATSVLRILMCPLLGLVVAVPVAFAGLPLRVRSTTAMRLYGALAGVFAVWFAWVYDISLLRPASDASVAPAWALWDLVQSPAIVWEQVNALADAGRPVFGMRMGAGVLWTLWAIEALLVVGAATWYAPRAVRGRMFCEPCGRWLVDHDPIRVSSRDVADYRVRREGLASLMQSPAPEARDGEWFWIRRWRCPKCATTVVFEVDKVLGCPVRNPSQLSPEAVTKFAFELVPPSLANEADRDLLRRLSGDSSP